MSQFNETLISVFVYTLNTDAIGYDFGLYLNTDLEDYAQLCASGNTLVPVLREVCRWLSQGLPMEAPVDCLTISEGLDINGTFDHESFFL